MLYKAFDSEILV